MADTFAKYHCNYCEEDINGLRVRCLECDDFDLCLQCFACGAKIGKHKATHGYQFMDTGNFSIFPGQGNWTAREEVRLLDAIEQYGYGNWDDIARHIETRTPEESRQKFIHSYIEGNVGRITWKSFPDALKTIDTESHLMDTGPLSPTFGSSLPPQPLPPEETAILGYMDHRDDFDREWDNDAESTIAPLFIHPVEDDDLDKALKLAQVDMYIRRLRERSRRKRVVRDFQLVQQFAKKEKERALPNPPKKKNKDDREVLSEKLRPLSQFMTAIEFHNLLSSMVKERELRIRIRELLRYRRNGIQHAEECGEFEVARARREKKKEFKRKTGNLPPQTPTILGDQLSKLKENDEKNLKGLVERKSMPLDIGGGRWPNGNSSDNGSSNSSNSLCNRSQTQTGFEDAVSIVALPGYHLLSGRERKLCSSLNLKPSQYISYKAVLLKEDKERHLGLTTSFPKGPQHIPYGLDARSQLLISSFFASAGWISQ